MNLTTQECRIIRRQSQLNVVVFFEFPSFDCSFRFINQIIDEKAHGYVCLYAPTCSNGNTTLRCEKLAWWMKPGRLLWRSTFPTVPLGTRLKISLSPRLLQCSILRNVRAIIRTIYVFHCQSKVRYLSAISIRVIFTGMWIM